MWKTGHTARDCNILSPKGPRIGGDSPDVAVMEADGLANSDVVDNGDSGILDGGTTIGWVGSKTLDRYMLRPKEQLNLSGDVVCHSCHRSLRFGNDKVSVVNSVCGGSCVHHWTPRGTVGLHHSWLHIIFCLKTHGGIAADHH